MKLVRIRKIEIVSFLFLTLLSFTLWSQNEIKVINLVTNEICANLNPSKSLNNLSKTEGLKIIETAIKKYNAKWEKEKSRFPKSNLRGLLTRQLLIDCENYWIIDAKLDNESYYAEEKYFSKLQMNRYFIVKRLLIDACKVKEASSLLKYFDERSDQNQLLKNMTELVQELKIYASNSIIDLSAPPKSTIFYTTFLDYQKGNSLLSINFQFNDTNDLLINTCNFFPYDKTQKSNAEWEKIDIKNIPPPPPPPIE